MKMKMSELGRIERHHALIGSFHHMSASTVDVQCQSFGMIRLVLIIHVDAARIVLCNRTFSVAK